MRKIIVISMITLDGVMQAPGGPEEDTSGGFKYGGWTAPYLDEAYNAFLDAHLQPAEYLLGRKTFDIFESYWPKHSDDWPGINNGMKYVMSKTRGGSSWRNVTFIKELQDIKALRNTEGPNLQVWGSSQLLQLLLENDFVDELHLLIHPLTLGKGKKLFNGGSIPAVFTLTAHSATPSGVILASYTRAGEVETGTVES